MTIRDHVLHLQNGKLAPDTQSAHVAKVVDAAFDAARPGGVVVHFHGGLVSQDAGLKKAERLAPRYAEDGQAFPIFLVWESGLLEILKNNLGEIAREPIFRHLWKRLAEFSLSRLTQDHADRADVMLRASPQAWAVSNSIDIALDSQNEAALISGDLAALPEVAALTAADELRLQAELERDPVLNEEILKVSSGLRLPHEIERDSVLRRPRVVRSTATLMDPTLLNQIVDGPHSRVRGTLSTAKLARIAIEILGRVIRRYAEHRDHGFHATIVEEILRALYLANAGKLVWDLIKRDTADAFGDDPQLYGGTALLHHLKRRFRDGSVSRVTLVGHSTGAIFISEFLDKAREILPRERFGVVFLAPASTLDKTWQILEQHRARISGFRMFSMSDENERADCLIPVVYPYSLLYFVSGVLEEEADEPILGMQCFLDGRRYPAESFPTLEQFRSFLLHNDGHAVWSVSDLAPKGFRSKALRHVDFDRDEATMESVAWILAHGF